MNKYFFKSCDISTPHIENSTCKEKLNIKKSILVFKGYILAILSGVIYCIIAVLVKKMANIHPGQLNVYRFIAIFAFSLPEVVKCRENLLGPKKYRCLLFISNICGATQSYLSYLAFRFLPLGEASVILFSNPATVTVAAKIFLKEPCGISQIITVIITLIGIIFTAKLPSYFTNNPIIYSKELIYGIVSALVSLIFNTFQLILMRKLRQVHYAVMMFNLGWVAVIETIILTAVTDSFKWNMCGVQNFYSILIGLLSYIAATLVTLAFKFELASTVSTVRAAADIISSLLWQTFYFKDIPDSFSIIGAILVLFSLVFIGMTKWLQQIKDKKHQR